MVMQLRVGGILRDGSLEIGDGFGILEGVKVIETLVDQRRWRGGRTCKRKGREEPGGA
jgi:hypothetical protein